MDKEYVILQVGEIVDSEYGKRFKIRIGEDRLGTSGDWVSGFTKWPEKLIEGATIYGHIEVKGQYKNWKFGKKPVDQGPAAREAGLAEIKNILTLQVIPLLESMNKELLSMRAKVFPDERSF